MVITFGNDNDVIVYTLERIISYRMVNHHIFVTQCVWWLASIIGLQERLVIHIDNLQIQSEDYQKPSATHSDLGNIHSSRVQQVERIDSGVSEYASVETNDSEFERQDTILKGCKEFLLKCEESRKGCVKKSRKQKRKDLVSKGNEPDIGVRKFKKNLRTYHTLTDGIEKSELDR